MSQNRNQPNQPNQPNQANNLGEDQLTDQALWNILASGQPMPQMSQMPQMRGMMPMMPMPQMLGFQNYGFGQNFGFGQNYGFANYTHQRNPSQGSGSGTVNIDDDEVIPDTPPSVTRQTQTQPPPPFTQAAQTQTQPKPKRSHKKKPANEPRKRAPTNLWKDVEHEALVRAWLEIAEDEIVADFQRGPTFMTRVRESFYTRLGIDETVRTHDMISGKWSDLSSKCMSFGNIYTRKQNSQTPSGSGGDWAWNAAKEEYKLRTGVNFQYEKVFPILRGHPKWEGLTEIEVRTTRHSSKKSKTSSSAATSSDARTFDLNMVDDDDDDEGADVGVSRLEKKRPKGRGRGKKPASRDNELEDDLAKAIALSMKEMVEEGKTRRLQKEKHYEDLAKHFEDQATINKRKDLEELSRDISHLTGYARQLAEQLKEDIAKKYGLI